MLILSLCDIKLDLKIKNTWDNWISIIGYQDIMPNGTDNLGRIGYKTCERYIQEAIKYKNFMKNFYATILYLLYVASDIHFIK